MHEFSLADDLLKAARDEARKAGLVKLDRIHVCVGDLSGVSIDPLEFAFGFLREEDEMTKGTELVIERIKGEGRCEKCGRDIELERLFLYCPHCETPTVEITGGRDFIIAKIEGEREGVNHG